MSLPTEKATLDLCRWKLGDSSTSRMGTGVTIWLGTSTPTTEIFPGTGAIRTLEAPKARATSSARLVSLFRRPPCSRLTSYRVTEGPCTAPMTRPLMPKDFSVSASRDKVSSSSSLAAWLPSRLGAASRSREGKTYSRSSWSRFS